MTDASETWTIGRLLQWTTDYLRQRGVENPRLDTEVLLAHARRCERIELYAAYGDIATETLRNSFRDLVRRRAEGVPVAYLVGYREFFSLSFLVTKDVLIPRPETELLVETVLDLVKGQTLAPTPRIVDVGTGCGNIAISLAKYLAGAGVTAVDASAAALHVARSNAERHQVADRLTLVLSDLLTDLADCERFNVIVSNPPYVSEGEYQELPPEITKHEPRSALVAGPSGIEVIRRLVQQSVDRLHVGGWLLFEISPMIEMACRELLSDALWIDVQVIRDLSGKARLVQARRAA